MSAEKAARPALPTGLAPRGLSRVQAAAYVGISPGLFDQLVAEGRFPKPLQFHSRLVWDRVALDGAFETQINGGQDSANYWDRVLK
ncbi:MAG: helix-turn-helix transcriptional regulator [Rhodospirillaceae bacterium]